MLEKDLKVRKKCREKWQGRNVGKKCRGELNDYANSIVGAYGSLESTPEGFEVMFIFHLVWN